MSATGSGGQAVAPVVKRAGQGLALADLTQAGGQQADHAWRRFCQRIGYGLDFLRQGDPVVRALPRGPWAILQALGPRWQGKREAYPGQQWLADYTGFIVRVIRDETSRLERAGLIVRRRERQPDGHERIVYMAGPALLAGARAFVASYPDRPRVVREPAAESAGGVPAAHAGELSDLSLQNRTSLSSSLNGTDKQEERPTSLTETDREVATFALAELRRRSFPDRAPVPVFDAAQVETAALCAASVPGDVAAKKQAMTDAIAHAFERSKGTPTPRYIWSTPEQLPDARGTGAEGAARPRGGAGACCDRRGLGSGARPRVARTGASRVRAAA